MAAEKSTASAPTPPSARGLDTSVLKFHEKLNPRFWLPNGQLRAVVRERLRKIADAYLAYLGLPKSIVVRDITFTGSLTGRNYTPSSDIDVHFLVDYGEVAKFPELVGDFFNMKRKEWAESYPVTVYGYPVELYVQDQTQFQHDPAGHFSIRKNKWVHPTPEPVEGEADEKAIQIARDMVAEAKKLLAMPEGPAQLAAINEFDARFKTTRQKGLATKAGVYSPENLAFKILRNSGSLDKVKQKALTIQTQALTLNEHHIPTSMNPLYRISESQVATLQRALLAEQNFLLECTEMNRLLTEGDLLEEGLGDKLTEKLKSLLGSGGPALLRKSVMAAVLGGSLLLSTEAIADAARKAGLDQGQVAQLSRDVEQAQKEAPAAGPQNTNFGKALQELNQRYVIDNADATKQKQYMHFTGNVADVTGIGSNGYPLFQAGSPSQKALDAAFATPQVITGVVNAPDKNGVLKNFAGKFVKANGLYYVYTQNSQAPTGQTVTSPEPAATPAPAAAPTSAPSAAEQKHMFDFKGLLSQAKQRFDYKKRPNGTVTDNVFGGPKTYTQFVDYAYDFVRQSGTGLENYTNPQIDQLFAKGLKVMVPKLPAGLAGK